MLISKGIPTAHSDQTDARGVTSKTLLEAANIVTDRAMRMSNHAVSTAKIIISAEERLRTRVRSFLRVAVATAFFALSGLVSLGANVTTAFAKKASFSKRHHGLRIKTHGNERPHYQRTRMTGMASWYGKGFNRQRTASGVRFNSNAMMAAHRTLPFGTKVLVTNLDNHKTCIVEITDRGPYAKGRIIDLSRAAAEKLDMTRRGVARVELAVLGSSGPSSSDNIADLSNNLELSHPPINDALQTASVIDEPTP